MRKNDIKLIFDNNTSLNEAGKHVRDGLSAAFRTGDNLWVSCDERSSLERLRLTEDHTFGEHQTIDLNKYLKLPTAGNCEIDIEGLGHGNHYLWLVGSHSLARKKPRKDDSPARQIKRLAKLKDDPNRYMLARIPLIQEEQSGNYELFKSCPHPDKPDQILTAAQLVGHEKGNQLMAAMADDIHFKDFLKIPGKDNGFDIEGLAVSGDRVFLGIRGPVLRGWASILEIQVRDTQDGYFELKPDKQNRLYKKHFLHLEGMGIRELRVSGNDLLLLAGPSMDLDGTIAVYRWPDALLQEEEAIVHRKDLVRLFDVPHGSGPATGKDKAEGMALYDDQHVLIVHDSPTDDRKIAENGVIADLYAL
ncbi:MAG: hypothetical protein JWQ14_155 [Adhaeribacter sp.]|jgi:hypothetical protein|nr:hypothetical protein [Adhaeribacter sp.]